MPTKEQVAEMIRLKSYFPFRIVWVAVSPDGEPPIVSATVTRREPNRLARLGWSVYFLKSEKLR